MRTHTEGQALQRDKHHALGGLGLLAHGYDAAGAHQAAAGVIGHLCANEQLPF
jgi:hypothetical protein